MNILAKLIVAGAIGVLLAVALAIPSGAAEHFVRIPAGNSEIPAAVMGRSVPPLASFGVMQCGEVVAIWVVLQDKSVVRTDAMHHPDTPEEYNAFLTWLTTAQEDIYTIPCPADKVGGKAHKKEPS